MSLLEMPVEVLVLIARLLTPSQLLALACSCKFTSSLLDFDGLWHELFKRRWPSPTSHTLNNAGELVTWKQRYSALSQIHKLFNDNPKQCLQQLLDDGLILPYDGELTQEHKGWATGEGVQTVPQFLYGTRLLDTSKVKWTLRHFGFTTEPFGPNFALGFVAQLSFHDLDFLMGLRHLIKRMAFPNSSSAISRLCTAFVQVFCLQNGVSQHDQSHMEAVCFSLLMLNTDLHTVGMNSMSRNQYIHNVETVTGANHAYFSRELLGSWYDSIDRHYLAQSEPIKQGLVTVYNTRKFGVRKGKPHFAIATTASFCLYPHNPKKQDKRAEGEGEGEKEPPTKQATLKVEWTQGDSVELAQHKSDTGFRIHSQRAMLFVPADDSAQDWVAALNSIITDL